MSCTCLLSTGVLIIGGTVCAGSRGHGCVAVTTGGLAESSIYHERFIALAPARLHTCMVTAESIRLRRLVQSTYQVLLQQHPHAAHCRKALLR